MFTTPIAHTQLTNLDEVLKYSYLTDRLSTRPMVRWQNNGQIAFSDANNRVYVTPYRPEIHSILENAGYQEDSIWVPFSNAFDVIPEHYKWLKKMADEACYAYTYVEAKKIADAKGIKPVEINQKVHIKQISYFVDETNQTIFSELATMYLHNLSKENIGTYIVVDQKTLLVCDEYGRTFLIRVKNVINDIVNTLIKAGYTHTTHPELYVHHIHKV